jgi:transposase
MLSLHLAEIGRQVAPGAHAALLLDGAGYHVAHDLVVPDNVTLVHLPPYAPELNPMENVWAYLRGNKLAITVFDDYDDGGLTPHRRQNLRCLELLRPRSRSRRLDHHTAMGFGHALGPLV